MFGGNEDEDSNALPWFIIAAIAAAAIGGAIAGVGVAVGTALNVGSSGGGGAVETVEDGAGHDGADEDGAGHDGADEDGADHDGADEDGAPATSAAPAAIPTTPSPFETVVEILPDGSVVLTGAVADQDTMDALVSAAEDEYGAANVTSELTIDDSLEPGGAPTVRFIGAVGPGERGSATAWAGDFAGDRGGSIDDQLAEGEFIEAIVSFENGIVTLTGEVPDEDTRAALVADATAQFGADRVVDELTVAADPEGRIWRLIARGELDSDELDAGVGWMKSLAAGAGARFDDSELGVREVSELEASLNELAELEPITFETGSAVITEQGQATLDKAVVILLDNPGVALTIEGHTDSDGSTVGNQALSQARAEAVQAYFGANGVDATGIVAVGKGEAEPIASNETDEGKAANRRIEFVVD